MQSFKNEKATPEYKAIEIEEKSKYKQFVALVKNENNRYNQAFR